MAEIKFGFKVGTSCGTKSSVRNTTNANKEVVTDLSSYVDIPGYNGVYKINKEGKVISNYSGEYRYIKPYFNGSSYIIELKKDGKRKRPSINSLLSDIFDNYCDNGTIDFSEFVPIKGFEDYMINKDGVVIKLKGKTNSNHIMAQYIILGYKNVMLVKDGIQRTKKVHHLLAEAFIPNPNNYPIVNHIDENKLNNNLDNLEWCTHQYNSAYSNGKNIIKENLETGEKITYNGIKLAERENNFSHGLLTKYIEQERVINNCIYYYE